MKIVQSPLGAAECKDPNQAVLTGVGARLASQFPIERELPPSWRRLIEKLGGTADAASAAKR